MRQRPLVAVAPRRRSAPGWGEMQGSFTLKTGFRMTGALDSSQSPPGAEAGFRSLKSHGDLILGEPWCAGRVANGGQRRRRGGNKLAGFKSEIGEEKQSISEFVNRGGRDPQRAHAGLFFGRKGILSIPQAHYLRIVRPAAQRFDELVIGIEFLDQDSLRVYFVVVKTSDLE